MGPLQRSVSTSLSSFILIAFALSFPDAPRAQPATLDEAFGTSIAPGWQTDDDRQYDFWLGKWTGTWRGRDEGSFFHNDGGLELEHWLFPVLDGKAIVELSLSDAPDPDRRVAGFSIRYFDRDKDRWVMAQDWPGWTQRGFVDQLQGFERFGRVEVYSTYPTQNGERTRRYTFSDIRDGAFRWDNAATGDSGRTWGPGSIVEFRRDENQVELGPAGGPLTNMGSERFCSDEAFSRLDAFEGVWQDGETVLVAARFNSGCAVMAVLDDPAAGSEKELFAWTYVPDPDVWTQLYLAGSRAGKHELSAGELDGDALLLARNPALEIRGELEVLDVSELLPAEGTHRTRVGVEGSVLEIVWEELRDGEWTVVRDVRLERAR